MRSPLPYRLTLRVAVALLLASAFVTMFVLNFNELRREREIQEHLTRTSGWAVVQVEQEILRLLDTLARYAHAEPEVTQAVLHERVDLLWSRFPVALNGPESMPAKAIPGVAETLQSLFRDLQAIEPDLLRLRSGDEAGYRRLRARIEAMRTGAHQLVLTVVYSPELIQAREANLRIKAQTSTYLTGMLGTAALLVLFLLVELWRNRRYARHAHAAHHRADLASRAKSEFLANMSHELRTPLHSILGFADLLEEEVASARPGAGTGTGTGAGKGAAGPSLDYIADIRAAGRHLLQIVNDLLDLARIEAGRLELVETEFDAGAVLRGCVRLVNPRAQAGGLAITVTLPDRPMPVQGDERLFRQVLLNVLSNAVKFTPEGGQVEVRAGRDSAGLTVTVRDTGPGIANEHIPLVLEPFGQADGSLRRQHDGVGLGLALARRFTEMHGGSLELESELGIGTAVTVRLPASRLLKRAVTVEAA